VDWTPPHTRLSSGYSKAPGLHFSFRDLDESAPTGAIKTRLETLDYFLKREIEKLRRKPSSNTTVTPALDELARLEPVIVTSGRPEVPACLVDRVS
jgi:hypothetical protein